MIYLLMEDINRYGNLFVRVSFETQHCEMSNNRFLRNECNSWPRYVPCKWKKAKALKVPFSAKYIYVYLDKFLRNKNQKNVLS